MSNHTTPCQPLMISLKRQAVRYALNYSEDLQIILAEITERLLNGEDGLPKLSYAQIRKLFPLDWKSNANVQMLVLRYGRRARNKKAMTSKKSVVKKSK